MNILNQEHFDNVKAHAESLGLISQLQSKLDRLKELAGPDSEPTVGYDWAPYSLSFTAGRLHGGVIYREGYGWSIHT